MDMGGYVIIINAEKVTVTGNKFNQKLYRSHPTAKPGTLKVETFKQLNEVMHMLTCSCSADVTILITFHAFCIHLLHVALQALHQI